MFSYRTYEIRKKKPLMDSRPPAIIPSLGNILPAQRSRFLRGVRPDLAQATTGAAQLADDVEAANVLVRDSWAPNTNAAYASDWRKFVVWCESNRLQPLPAAPDTVAVFMGAMFNARYKASSIGRYLSSISHYHQEAKLESPTKELLVRRAYKGARRKRKLLVDQKDALTVDLVIRMVDRINDDGLVAIRDRAILLFGFASAMRRSELADMQINHLKHQATGLRIVIPHSKANQEGAPEIISILQDAGPHCPVTAIKDWLAVLSNAGMREGPVFRRLENHTEELLEAGLSDKAIYRIVKKYASRAGLNPAFFGAHSLRAGFITTADAKGKSLKSIMKQSRHISVKTLMRYIRPKEDIEHHAGRGLMDSK